MMTSKLFLKPFVIDSEEVKGDLKDCETSESNPAIHSKN